jgi:hypothetical protein
MPGEADGTGRVLTVGDYVFTFEPDPSKPGQVLVRPFRDGAPVLNLHGEPFAKAYPATSLRRIEAFCRKFATDEPFRNATLVRDAFSCC